MLDLLHGQEIYAFFGRQGNLGVASLVISCAILGFLIYKTLMIADNEKINTYREFLISGLNIRNAILADALNIIVTTFLALSFVVMITGAGAYLKQEFNIPLQIGSCIICGFCMIFIASKTSRLIKLNMILIPILIFLMLLLGLFFTYTNLNIQTEKNIQKIILNPILYASYNSITLIPVLICLKSFCNTKKSAIFLASICTGILIFLGINVLNILRRHRKHCKN